MKRRASRWLLIAAALSLIAAVPRSSTARPAAYGAAWAVWISTPVSDVISLATASAQTGSTARAGGAPVAVAGASPKRADAVLSHPDAAVAPLDWADPTGSMTIKGGFAQAHAATDSASAKSGLSTSSGSGFAMADKLLSPDRQTQLLGTWADTMNAVFTPINDALSRLGPALALAGLEVPHLTPPAPDGFLDIALADQVASSVDVSSAPGIASSRAQTAIADVRLLAGFIEARGVKTTAVSESVDGADTREATATIGSLKIAGVEVVADGDGFRVARNTLLARTTVQPALDLLMSTLTRAGVTLRVAGSRSDGTLREASALELGIDSPRGPFVISIAHAEAAAPVVEPLALPSASPAVVPPSKPAPSLPVALPPVSSTVPGISTTPGGTLARPYAGPVTWRPSPAVARALRTSYLLLIVGALLGALVLPMLGRSAARRAPAARRVRPRPTGGIP
jgi:hypothetical protein